MTELKMIHQTGISQHQALINLQSISLDILPSKDTGDKKIEWLVCVNIISERTSPTIKFTTEEAAIDYIAQLLIYTIPTELEVETVKEIAASKLHALEKEVLLEKIYNKW